MEGPFRIGHILNCNIICIQGKVEKSSNLEVEIIIYYDLVRQN